MYRLPPQPYADQTKDATYAFPRGATWESVGARRRSPCEVPPEFDPIQGSGWQGEKKNRHSKPKYYFTRPSDGKRRGAMGRLKDALTGEGADVFITITRDKRSLMRDRPQRWQWTNWGHPGHETSDAVCWNQDWRAQDGLPLRRAPWARNNGKYNFRSRKYESPKPSWYANPNSERLWVDARWEKDAKYHDMHPLSKQYFSGECVTRVPLGVSLCPHGAGGRSGWSGW